MPPLTKEQKEYISLKNAFERMFKNYVNYRKVIKCCEISDHKIENSEYIIEDIFNNLLEKHKKTKTIT